MKVNRIWLVVALIFLASALYEGRIKPQSRPIYERALVFYRQGNYEQSLAELNHAYAIEPNSTAILVLMGWNELKLGQQAQARENFSRAARLDPQLTEAKLGLMYLGLEDNQANVRIEEVRTMLAEDPSNRDFQLAAAALLRQAGRNREAASMFRNLLGQGNYSQVARLNLEQLYGLEGVDEEIPEDLPTVARPEELQIGFRTEGSYWQRRNGAGWENFYIKGLNVGPAVPGAYSSEPPTRVADYLRWFEQIASLHTNTIRAITILPPAFYRALRIHNDDPEKSRLYLIQGIWLVDAAPAGNDLFQPSVDAVSRQEIAHAIDVIHGQGDVPARPGHSGGLYAVDVSQDVVGLLIGREWEPHLVEGQNQANPERTSYAGRFVSLGQGNAMEAWLAGMLDYAALYETQRYNHQTPLGIVNWPALDPLTHPTEATVAQESVFRRRLGEDIPPGLEENIDDNDAVSVDDTAFRKSPELVAGLFASYSVFPYFPDFLYREPDYLKVRDVEGPNPFLGYLQALKAHYRGMPLLAAAYGMSTSIGIARFHPYGLNHGGLTEREQGAALARMTNNLSEAGWAGGLITEWQDEWYKVSWLTRPFSLPPDRQPLWNNQLDPDQALGLWTYDPSGEERFWSSFSGWDQATRLYVKDRGPVRSFSDGWDAERTLRSLAVSSDEAFLYLRLQVGNVRMARNNLPDLQQSEYFVGISTDPGRFGSRIQPGLSPQVRSEPGANYLLHFGRDGVRLLIASNYNPREVRPISGLTANVALGYRIPFHPELEEWSGFEEILVETNRRSFSRAGRMFPPQRHSLSQLRYRIAGQTDDTVATWTCDFSGNAFVVRIPWALLFFTDPSSRRVLAGTEGGPQFVTAETPGIQFYAVSLRPGDPIAFGLFPSGGVPVADSLPALDERGAFQNMQIYSWPKWDSVSVSGRWKAGYTAVQNAFQQVTTQP